MATQEIASVKIANQVIFVRSKTFAAVTKSNAESTVAASLLQANVEDAPATLTVRVTLIISATTD